MTERVKLFWILLVCGHMIQLYVAILANGVVCCCHKSFNEFNKIFKCLMTCRSKKCSVWGKLNNFKHVERITG